MPWPTEIIESLGNVQSGIDINVVNCIFWEQDSGLPT
jgi:hypothetical protein